jgi:hypothetical protein
VVFDPCVDQVETAELRDGAAVVVDSLGPVTIPARGVGP